MAKLDVKKIRKDFPILGRKIRGKPLVYLDNAATTQKPRQVIAAITDYYSRHNANVHRGVHTLSGEATDMVEEARGKVAAFIGASSKKEIIFVRNATEAINLVLYSWGEQNIGKGDGVVISFLEHHSNLVGWQQLVKRKKASLKVVEISQEGELLFSGSGKKVQGGKSKFWIGSLEALLDKKVKLVAVTQVSNVLGTITPISEVVAEVRQRAPEALILVDGAQSVPHMPVDVSKMNVDFLAFSAHKMLGPTGIGVLWAKRELLEQMRPFLYGGDMISEVKLTETIWNRLPWKFEAGTPNMAGIVGLGAAIDYLASVGMDQIHTYEQRLLKYAFPLLENLEKKGILNIYGPRDLVNRLGILTFNVCEVHAHDAAQVIDSEGVAVRSGHHCAMPLTERLGTAATVRASFYLYNTREEVDVLIKAIKKVGEVFKL